MSDASTFLGADAMLRLIVVDGSLLESMEVWCCEMNGTVVDLVRASKNLPSSPENNIANNEFESRKLNESSSIECLVVCSKHHKTVGRRKRNTAHRSSMNTLHAANEIYRLLYFSRYGK
jgi:hypothetical protein